MVTQVGILNHGKMLFEGSLQALQKHSRGGILLRVLEIVHLTADAHRKVGQYSLGMKQRLGIAMALLGSPCLLYTSRCV